MQLSEAVTWHRRLTAPIARYLAIVVVGLLGVGAVVEALVDRPANSVPGLLALLCLVGLATTLPLALPHATVAGLSMLVAAVVSLAALHTLTVAGFTAQAVAADRLGARGRPAVAAAAAVPYLLIAALSDHRDVRIVATALAALVPAIALAATVRRMRRADLENRAARQAIAGTLIEHTARGERARIARELHDVVAHHISMVAVQAETARLTTPGLPPAGAQRLSAIGDTARSALTEMRRLLGVLREDAETDVGPRRPQPGLAQLNDLVDEARDTTGAGTRLILHGSPVTLDPGVELAAYRIIQEALTNSRRHAPGAAVDVEVHYADDVLRLSIRDNGSGSSGGPAGLGLLGMSERAAAVGGRLRAGPASTGGFLVEARLPTRAEEAR
ncbi:MAG TPA: histidine kinase [Micromonosporaceae bacterium]